jgi:hypothetical protein
MAFVLYLSIWVTMNTLLNMFLPVPALIQKIQDTKPRKRAMQKYVSDLISTFHAVLMCILTFKAKMTYPVTRADWSYEE